MAVGTGPPNFRLSTVEKYAQCSITFWHWGLTVEDCKPGSLFHAQPLLPHQVWAENICLKVQGLVGAQGFIRGK